MLVLQQCMEAKSGSWLTGVEGAFGSIPQQGSETGQLKLLRLAKHVKNAT